MTDLPVEHFANILEYAYQQQDTALRDSPSPHSANILEAAYQQHETKLEPLPFTDEPTVSDTSVSGGILWVKVVLNIIMFAFTRKGYVFDGSQVREWASPTPVIFPALVSDGSRAYLAGGLHEDGSVEESLWSYGEASYMIESDKDSLAMVIAGDKPVYLVDEHGSVKLVISSVLTVPFNLGWRLVSKAPFKAIVTRVY